MVEEFFVKYLSSGQVLFAGTDEDALIDVVTSRNNQQRNRIMLDYKTSYGRVCKKKTKVKLKGMHNKEK